MKRNLRDELEAKLAGRSPSDRRALFVGILNAHLPEGSRAVLVGGALVELYTTGAYVTGDVDLLAEKEKVRPLLKRAGFEEQGRYLFRDDLGIVAEIPSRYGRPTETVVEIGFEGYTLPCVSIEDSIVDRIRAAKSGRSPTDWEQAILLFTAQQKTINLTLLRSKAEPNDVADKVEELVRLVASGRKPKGRS